MKRIVTILLSAAGLLGFASLAGAQIVPPPSITSVPSRDSFNPGRVQILGTNMGLVQSVKIDGVFVPIIRTTSTKVVAGPLEPRAPGFGTVEVKSGLNSDSAPIQFTPTLEAKRRRTTLTVTIDADDVGSYIIRYNSTLLGAPVVDQGIHYQRFFQTLGGGAGILRSGVFADPNPVTFQTLFPVQIGLVGAPVHFQAECTVGASKIRSYTNLVTVPGFAIH